jgi:AbrB family looped-hinge helix DNA binding protein
MDVIVTSKGRITIPKAIRDLLKFKAGDRLEFLVDANGRVAMSPAAPVDTLHGVAELDKAATKSGTAD